MKQAPGMMHPYSQFSLYIFTTTMLVSFACFQPRIYIVPWNDGLLSLVRICLTLPPCCPLYPMLCSTPTDLQLPSWQCYPNPPFTSSPDLLASVILLSVLQVSANHKIDNIAASAGYHQRQGAVLSWSSAVYSAKRINEGAVVANSREGYDCESLGGTAAYF